MSATLILPPMEALASVAAEMSEAAREAGDLPTMRATDKAMLQLHEGTSPIPTIGGWLLESRTRPGIVHRLSVTHGCNCEAGQNGKVCWHKQLMAIVERTAEQFTMPALARAQAEAEIGELFDY